MIGMWAAPEGGSPSLQCGQYYPVDWGGAKVKAGGSQPVHASSSLHEKVHPLLLPSSVDIRFQLQWELMPAILQGAPRPAASHWGSIIGLSCFEASSFLNWAATGFSGSPVGRWPLLNYPHSNYVSRSNKSPHNYTHTHTHTHTHTFYWFCSSGENPE
jgi:hypothetical protein